MNYSEFDTSTVWLARFLNATGTTVKCFPLNVSTSMTSNFNLVKEKAVDLLCSWTKLAFETQQEYLFFKETNNYMAQQYYTEVQKTLWQ